MMSIYGTLPPQCLDAERVLLLSALHYDDTARIVACVHPTLFYREVHRDVAAAIQALVEIGNPVDRITVKERLIVQGSEHLDACVVFMAEPCLVVVRRVKARAYLSLIVDAAFRRELMRVGRESAEDAATMSIGFFTTNALARDRLLDLTAEYQHTMGRVDVAGREAPD